MNTWHELVAVKATYHPTGTIIPPLPIGASRYWWAARPSPLIRVGVDSSPVNFMTLELTPIASPSWMDNIGVSFLDAMRVELEWDLYTDPLAGIVMAKRLETPTQTEFQFITRWSITEDTRRDAEGFAETDHEVDLDGELDIEQLEVRYAYGIGFEALRFIEMRSGATTAQAIAGALRLDVFSNQIGHSLWWLDDNKLIERKGAYPQARLTPITITDRGRAFLRGDILP